MRCPWLVSLAVGLALLAAPKVRADAAPADPLAVLQSNNARLQRSVLDNGMVVLIKEDSAAPMAAIQLWVGSGSIYEGPYMGGGLSHFVEHMIFKGTTNLGPGELARRISDAGGDINAYTATDRTVFHCTLPATNWRTGVDMLADALMNATFPADEWERERDVILREFAMHRDDPNRVLGQMLWSTAYRVHPYRHPVIGYEDVFRQMSRTNLLAYFHDNYVPDNMIAVVVGDIDAAEVRDYLARAFAGFQRRPRPPVSLPAEPKQIAPRRYRQTGPYEISRLHLAWHTVALDHPDAPALDVLAAIVGDGRSSRLAQEIKENRRLAFNVDAWSSTPKDPGLFGISAQFEPNREAELLAALDELVAGWATNDFTQAEIEKARRGVLVAELSSLQAMDGQASSYASGEFYAGDPLFSERYLAAVQKINAADLRRVAAQYLRPDSRTLVILAPAGTDTGTVNRAEALEFKVERRALSNGVPLIVREDRRLPFVYICAALRGGLLSETATNNGITQLLADLLTRGTRTRSAEAIAELAERLGGSLAPFCGRNSFGLQVSCLTQDRETFAELMADCLFNPIFPPDEIEKQRAIQLASIRQQREQPFFIADEALRNTLFPNHPYRWTTQGAANTVNALTRDDLLAYHRRHVNRSNLVLAVFGDMNAEEALALVERYYSNLPEGEMATYTGPLPQPRLPARIKQREPREQTVILSGYPGVDLRDPRMDALGMIENSLSGLSSELAQEARERRGLVYAIGAIQRPGLQPGLFALYAAARENTAGEVEKLMDEQLARITAQGLTTQEFSRARAQILADHQASWQNNAGLAQTCALDELYGLGYRHSLDAPERVQALTPQDIQAAAASIFRPDRQAISIVLPEERTKPGEEPENHD